MEHIGLIQNDFHVVLLSCRIKDLFKDNYNYEERIKHTQNT